MLSTDFKNGIQVGQITPKVAFDTNYPQTGVESIKWGFWDRTQPLLGFCLMSCPNEKISFFVELKKFHFVEAFTALGKLARQDVTIFAFRPVPENFLFLWKTLTLELKLKSFIQLSK